MCDREDFSGQWLVPQWKTNPFTCQDCTGSDQGHNTHRHKRYQGDIFEVFISISISALSQYFFFYTFWYQTLLD